jgi:hypothetical protein
MRPSELKDGDRIITTGASVFNSVPVGMEGTVDSLVTCNCCSDRNGCFQAMTDFSKMNSCVFFSGAKVKRAK